MAQINLFKWLFLFKKINFNFYKPLFSTFNILTLLAVNSFKLSFLTFKVRELKYRMQFLSYGTSGSKRLVYTKYVVRFKKKEIKKITTIF